MPVRDWTHDQIADWCATRLRRMGYKIALSNLTSATHGEQPDVLGLTAYGRSIVVEVKVSRSDFHADKKKPWRQDPELGMGDQRVYLVPQGLLKVEEIPYGWQLWEICGKKRPTLNIVKGKHKVKIQHPYMRPGNFTTKTVLKNITKDELLHFTPKEKNYQRELTWLLKIASRAQENGIELNKFANNYQTS